MNEGINQVYQQKAGMIWMMMDTLLPQIYLLRDVPVVSLAGCCLSILDSMNLIVI